MKKLLILFVLGLFAFTNVYAEEVVANTPSNEGSVEQYVDTNVDGAKTEEEVIVTDDSLLDVALESLPEDTVMFDEEELETYRNAQMELEVEEDRALEGNAGGSSVVTTAIIILVIAAVISAGFVVLIKTGAIRKVA